MCLRPPARRMASVIVCDLWANSPICFFKRIGRLVVSHRSLRFAQMHFTSSLRKNPCSSVAPAAHQKPSSRTRSKSKESVKRPIRAHRLNPCFLIKASRMASVLLCAICGRNNLMPHGQSAIRKVPTAYGDGLWGLRTRISLMRTDQSSRISYSFLLFLMALWAYGF